MSGSPLKCQRKRSIEDQEETEVVAIELDVHPSEDDLDVADLNVADQRDFKKTPDEKRQRLDDQEEAVLEGLKQSSRSSSPFSVNISSSSSRQSHSSSKHNSPAEVIYQLSPEHNLSPLSSGSRTPTKKSKSSQEDGESVPSNTRRKLTVDEEEGEIVSDDERKGARHRKSVKIPDTKNSEAVLEEMDTTSTKTDQAQSENDSSEEESSNEEGVKEEGEEKGEDISKAAKQGTIVITGNDDEEEDSESDDESGSDIEESSDDEDEDSDDDEEIEDEETKDKELPKQGGGEEITKVQRKESSEEESSEESRDDDASESGSSEEESMEEEREVHKDDERKEQTKRKGKAMIALDDDADAEDFHKELKKLKDKKSVDERHKRSRRSRDDDYGRGSDWRRDSRLKEGDRDRSGRERKPYSQDRTTSQAEKLYSREKFHRDDRERRLVTKAEKTEYNKQDKYAGRERSQRSSGNKEERISYIEKERNLPVRGSSEADKRAPRKDSNKHKSSKDASRKESKSRERRETRERSPVPKKSKDKKADDTKIPKEDVFSSVLTETERQQFNQEVVELESEDSSVEDDNKVAPVFDEKIYDREEDEDEEVEEDEEEEIANKLPSYFPAVQGCRNVEEFQWLNRIEEGSYGVVYRAKDRRTGEVVALKKLKMEREKGGFPITSLREINTLLKARHVNIVTVREIVVGSNMDKIYIVMDYVEHDLKTLMDHMTNQFRIGEVKTLLIQLLRAVKHLHDNWILHRDIKTSNLLLSNKGILKVGDFGLAREYGTPLKNYTPIVVTLWYRAPELLLGVKEYSTPIDLWSVGCVFAELLTLKPLFNGRSEIDQTNKIFKELGTPSDKIWPGPPAYSELPFVKKMTFAEYPYNNLRNKFGTCLTDKGFDLLNRFLTYDPKKRITAEEALDHHFFEESPAPVDPAFFPTWPARSEMMKRPKRAKDYEHSPEAPEGGAMFAKLADEADGSGSQGFRMPPSKKGSAAVAGFTLKF